MTILYDTYKKYIIHNEDELDAFLIKAKQQSFVALDTEFARFNHFWPDLSLIQVAFEKQAYILDALYLKDAIKKFSVILDDPNIIKICHSGYQDIEVFDLITSTLPKSYFDTQIAGLFMGLQHQISYTDLVKNMLDIELDSSPSYLEWMQRPLTDKQKKYAFEDVIYLNEIYPKMCSALKKSKRLNWALEESLALINSYTQDQSIEYQWQKFSKSFSKPKPYHIGKALFYWREKEARGRNKPRHRILHNKILTKIALDPPKNLNQLRHIYIQEKQYFSNRYGDKILKLTHENMHVSEQSIMPPSDWRREKDPKIQSILQKLRNIRDKASLDHNIMSILILPKKDLISLSFLIFDKKYKEVLSHKCLYGWRKQLLFDDVKDLCSENS